MGESMTVRFRMSDLLTLKASPNAISSQVSEGGVTPSGLPAGLMKSPCGQVLVHANLSAHQARALRLMTSGTYGPIGIGSSNKGLLPSFLESKLKDVRGSNGGIWSRQTWKRKTTPQGREVWAHTASVRRICDNGCIGWPTPTVNDSRSGANRTARRLNLNSKHHD